MTKQMPGWMLRDHANLADAYKQHIHDGGESALGDFLRDEAARREGEALDMLADAPQQTAPDLVERLRNTPNWKREEFTASWKDGVLVYDRAPFEAADAIEALRARVETLEQDGLVVMTGREDLRARAEAAEADNKRLRKLASAMLAKTGVVLDRPVPKVGAPAVFVEYDAARALWDALAGGNDG